MVPACADLSVFPVARFVFHSLFVKALGAPLPTAEALRLRAVRETIQLPSVTVRTAVGALHSIGEKLFKPAQLRYD